MCPRLTDGSNSPPRLRYMHSLWGLLGLPRGGPEWSVEEKIRRAKEAGFEGIECPTDLFADPAVARAIATHGLALALAQRFMTPEDARSAAALAKRKLGEEAWGQASRL